LLPMSVGWNTRIGARGDYVRSTAEAVDPNQTSFLPPGPLRNSNGMYAFYLANDYQLSDYTTATLNFGQAQRAPTLVERYSDGVFVSVLQSGFSRVIGDPLLNPERLWQIDAGLSGDYGDTRAGFNVFHSWVLDYITFRGARVEDPTGAQLIRYFPTPLATLYGFEFKGERDLSSEWTAFLVSHYLQGQDQTLGAPLWGISPLEGQVGLRWNQVMDEETRGVELLVRMVASQNRLGVMRVGDQQTIGTTRIEQATPSFTTVAVRGFWNYGTNVRFVGGVENLFNATYLQHLDLRLPRGGGTLVAPPAPSGTRFPVYNPAFAYAPGITPYLGIDWTF
jgi:outer membrane receptor protein involved in Fe transport